MSAFGGKADEVKRTLTGRRRAVALPGERALLAKALAERFDTWLPRYMAGRL